jgi:DUF1009 family protein
MDGWRRLGLIAGGGDLPLRLAEAVGRSRVHVVRLAGIADARLADYPSTECGLAEAGGIIRALRTSDCDAACFAGVVRRPDFSRLKPDLRGAMLLPKVIAAASTGDGALLSVLVKTLEEEGFRVLGADDVYRRLTAPEGAVGRIRPSEPDLADIEKAAALIAALGPFDVAQGAVVVRGFVVAIEAAEGTDQMLDRARLLHPGEARMGVVVKRTKPGQERRIDLPTIGPETIRRAAAAHLAGVALEAGGALIVDRDETIALADRMGLFVYGFKA